MDKTNDFANALGIDLRELSLTELDKFVKAGFKYIEAMELFNSLKNTPPLKIKTQ